MYNHHIGIGSIASGPHSILPLSMQQKQENYLLVDNNSAAENDDLEAATLHSTTIAVNHLNDNMQKSTMISLDIKHDDGKSILEQQKLSVFLNKQAA